MDYERNKYNREREYNDDRRMAPSSLQYKSRDAIQNYHFKVKEKKRSGSGLLYFLITIFVLAVGALVTFGIVRAMNDKIIEEEEKSFTKEQMKNDIYADFSLIGKNEPIALRGKTKQDVYDEVLDTYTWKMIIKNNNPEIDIFDMPSVEYEYAAKENLDDNLNNEILDAKGTSQEEIVENPYSDITIDAKKETFEFPDFIEKQLMDFIDRTFEDYIHKKVDKKRKNIDENGNIIPDVSFIIDENDPNVDNYISQLSRLWNTKATVGMIEGYDDKRNEFIFGEEHKGYEIDEGNLRKKIYQAVRNGEFNTTIWTPLNIIEPTGESIKSKYKYQSIYETTTTDDKVRNTNIELACKALNGTIVKPGQEFSFNKTVGQRTEEKGYGYATAYVGGEVVQELGGGVCQVSTTLYNAVFGADLKTTYRRSHTFEPSYITPGLDATVSFNGVDYRFINDSDYSIGIRASYARRKVKVEIFAVPKLPKNQRQYLKSVKIEDLGYPDISIIDSGEPSRGTKGSEWKVYKIVKEGDKEIVNIFNHQARYVGHAPTAYEEDTYIDDDGKLATSRFTGKIPTTKAKRRSVTEKTTTRVTITERSTVIAEENVNNREVVNVPNAQDSRPYDVARTPE